MRRMPSLSHTHRRNINGFELEVRPELLRNLFTLASVNLVTITSSDIGTTTRCYHACTLPLGGVRRLGALGSTGIGPRSILIGLVRLIA